MQVGVVPDAKYEVVKGSLECESLVARCLWESHWREEWCGVYKKGIVFYAPLTQKPCMELCEYIFAIPCSMFYNGATNIGRLCLLRRS